MSKENRKQILDMLKEGKITFEEAEKLLDAIDSKKEKEVNVEVFTKPGSRKMLKIFIQSEDGDNVKVQIPVEFAKLIKNGKVNGKLDNYNIDIDSILEMIEEGTLGEIVNIETKDGEFVKIVVE